MDKATYQKRLEEILTDETLDPQYVTGSYLDVPKAIQAICLLNEEAIGADEPEDTEYEYYNKLHNHRNALKSQLKVVMGTTNG